MQDDEEWFYHDGCKVYGPGSPHGPVGPVMRDHFHALITAIECGACGATVKLDPPAETPAEADERAKDLCDC